MKKNENNSNFLYDCVGVLVGSFLILLFFINININRSIPNTDSPKQMFDTSAIEARWCGGFEDGTVRMVGAWWYADGVVEDEQGQLWSIEQNINTDDFLMLWIADNNTPNNPTDDVIIKVWREAY